MCLLSFSRRLVVCTVLLTSVLTEAGVMNTGWEPVSHDRPFEFVTTMTVVDGDLYVGTENNGVFRLPNGSSRWETVNEGLTVYPSGTREISALKPMGQAIYTMVNGQVYKSENKGELWTKVDGLPLFSADTSAFLDVDKTFYVGGQTGIYRSFDDGKSWQKADKGLPGLDYYHGKYVVSLAATSHATSHTTTHALYAGTFSHYSTCGTVYQSTDRGDNWQPVSFNASSPSSCRTNVVSLITSDDYATVFAALVGLDDVPLGVDLYAKKDLQAHWQLLNHQLNIHALYAFQGKLFAATVYQGIQMDKSGTGNHWAPFNEGLDRADDALVSAITGDTATGCLYAYISTNGVVKRCL